MRVTPARWCRIRAARVGRRAAGHPRRRCATRDFAYVGHRGRDHPRRELRHGDRRHREYRQRGGAEHLDLAQEVAARPGARSISSTMHPVPAMSAPFAPTPRAPNGCSGSAEVPFTEGLARLVGWYPAAAFRLRPCWPRSSSALGTQLPRSPMSADRFRSARRPDLGRAGSTAAARVIRCPAAPARVATAAFEIAVEGWCDGSTAALHRRTTSTAAGRRTRHSARLGSSPTARLRLTTRIG